MMIFVNAGETAIIAEGVAYLHIEGAFYCGLAVCFYFMDCIEHWEDQVCRLALTVFSLGTRVVLAYTLSAIPAVGVAGIWWSVPIGWFLADAVGLIYYKIRKKQLIPDCQPMQKH